MRRVIAAVVLAAMGTTGCIGTQGLGGKVKHFNLTVVEHPWAREGVFLVFTVAWIYRICTVLDLFIFNSIEFWSGTNPINGKSALADIPPAAAEKIGMNEIHRAQVERLSDTQAKLYLDFENGDHMSLDVVRDGQSYSVSYLGRALFEGKIQDAPE